MGRGSATIACHPNQRYSSTSHTSLGTIRTAAAVPLRPGRWRLAGSRSFLSHTSRSRTTGVGRCRRGRVAGMSSCQGAFHILFSLCLQTLTSSGRRGEHPACSLYWICRMIHLDLLMELEIQYIYSKLIFKLRS